MVFSWTIFFVVMVANAAYMAFMYLLTTMDKSLPARHSLIPGTNQKFLYMQDWYVMYDDLIAVPLIINAFAHLATNGFISSWQWTVFAEIAVADGIGFFVMCLGKNHKPDQGFPDIGKVSWHGLSHLLYHGIGVACTLLVIGHTIGGNVQGLVFYVALLGGVLYVASFVADLRAGNFDPIKREMQPVANSDTCRTCGQEFSKANPDFGGGVCQRCWSTSH